MNDASAEVNKPAADGEPPHAPHQANAPNQANAPHQPHKPHAPLAVFVSGGGRSLENLVALNTSGELEAPIGLVLSNRADAYALDRAALHGLPSRVIDAERALSPADFSTAAFAAAEQAGCGLVVLAGFLRLLVIPEQWRGRVLNIHPALLPAYGGKGYYGERVHRAVLAAGETQSGCTVHFVDNHYDTGPIILQRKVPVLPTDTVDSLAGRVFQEELHALPAAIRLCLDGKTPSPAAT
ncbi:MAG: phosphoribosylglycinamide formyltransferase [Planctomycetota bacterium]|nr:phosphoribosylglycinamide formyltransferase [Planctomycetota bacterium]MDP6368755.1 phosphoribosylglycinamide formyltransferase [Planctomycetota bacterium]MDP6519681.1 phosphoribosylglycinamide formyltransferase [Planctomycetota bacterium]